MHMFDFIEKRNAASKLGNLSFIQKCRVAMTMLA